MAIAGTKLGCGEGGCGACTVMVSSFNYAQKKIKHAAVNACLAPVVRHKTYSTSNMRLVRIKTDT